jgi:hypothetical protein
MDIFFLEVALFTGVTLIFVTHIFIRMYFIGFDMWNFFQKIEIKFPCKCE